MKVCVVGATGLVGTKMLEVLQERNFPVEELIPVASENSVGKEINFNNKTYKVVPYQTAISQKPDVALFSAGGNTSLQLAPLFAQAGIKVIDNTSAWRMHPAHKLVVPEVNGQVLESNDMIIANPNCSTIQLVMVLHPLHKLYNIKRVVVSTYQSVTGTGVKAVNQLMQERNNEAVVKVYPYTIDLNVIPHIDVFTENGYTKEEMKMTNETKKIMGDDNINLCATCVRIPVVGGHSESVNIEFEKDFNIDEITKTLNSTKGVIVQDDIEKLLYPMPITSHNKDEVFVGRIRKDISNNKAMNCWIVADNLRKGAATNAVQIAEYLKEKSLI